MHKAKHESAEPHYLVVAEVCEPNYDSEWQFLVTERAYVVRKMAERPPKAWSWMSAPKLGIYHRRDWRHYGHLLDKYALELGEYAEKVDAGLMPVKFAVYNDSGHADASIKIKIHVTDGRLDESKKAPARPPRLDGHSKPLKFKLPKLTRFSRTGIKITPHFVTARFSALGAHDGAMLINQLLHVHCGPDTKVAFEINSRRAQHETGEVEIIEVMGLE